MTRLILIATALIMTGCAAQPAKVSSTTWPQVTVAADRQAVSDVIISELSSADMTIEDISPSLLAFRMPDSAAAMQKVMFGCSYCADPYVRINFILSDTDSGTKIVSQYWRMVPTYNGSDERHDMTGSRSFNALQEMLWRLDTQLVK